MSNLILPGDLPQKKTLAERRADARAMEVVRFSVLSKPYSEIRRIIADGAESDTGLLRVLLQAHGIEFDYLREDPEIFYVVSSNQLDELRSMGIKEATEKQILGSCQIFDLDKARAAERFRAMSRE